MRFILLFLILSTFSWRLWYDGIVLLRLVKSVFFFFSEKKLLSSFAVCNFTCFLSLLAVDCFVRKSCASARCPSGQFIVNRIKLNEVQNLRSGWDSNRIEYKLNSIWAFTFWGEQSFCDVALCVRWLTLDLSGCFEFVVAFFFACLEFCLVFQKSLLSLW